MILDHSISNGGELQAFIIIKSKEKPCYNADKKVYTKREVYNIEGGADFSKLLGLQEKNLSQNLL